MRGDGSEARQVTNDEYHDGYPGWSPTGDWLVYDSARDGNTDLYLVPVDGGPQKRVTMDKAEDRHASWSPDGRSLLFHSHRDESVDIWQVEIPVLSTEIDDKTEDVLKGIVREAYGHIDNEEDKGKKYIEIKNLSQADTYRENHAGLIYHWQNRILPIKFILTVLGAMIVTKKTAMITLDELQEAVISDTESFRK